MASSEFHFEQDSVSRIAYKDINPLLSIDDLTKFSYEQDSVSRIAYKDINPLLSIDEMTSTNFTNLLKIRLKRGQKYPVEKWTAVKNQYKKINTDEYNAGVPMKPNNLVGVDLDSAKWGANHIWYEKFGADIEAYCKLLNTLTVRTPSGGYHLYRYFYFKYHENLPQTQSDIRRDNGFRILVCPPSFTRTWESTRLSTTPRL